MRKFLTAYWHDLIMANYEVDPAVLADYVPAGTELDLDEGKCFISLVGLMFIDTRVLGIPIPFHINFEEVNLRFYVRRETEGEVRRAVTFVREIVPRFAVSTVARLVYEEPYETWKMKLTKSGDDVEYYWSRGGVENRLSVSVRENLGVPPPGSHGEFIIEHYWGYTKRRGGRTDEYKVEHPAWDLYSVDDVKIDVDFGSTYGEKFAFLTEQKPYSVLFAKGDRVAVYQGEKIR